MHRSLSLPARRGCGTTFRIETSDSRAKLCVIRPFPSINHSPATKFTLQGIDEPCVHSSIIRLTRQAGRRSLQVMVVVDQKFKSRIKTAVNYGKASGKTLQISGSTVSHFETRPTNHASSAPFQGRSPAPSVGSARARREQLLNSMVIFMAK